VSEEEMKLIWGGRAHRKAGSCQLGGLAWLRSALRETWVRKLVVGCAASFQLLVETSRRVWKLGERRLRRQLRRVYV
jgi:hypothetical protein